MKTTIDLTSKKSINQSKPNYQKTLSDQKNSINSVLLNKENIPGISIILAYFLVVTFTPNFLALDTNAPKFLTLAILNSVSFFYLLYQYHFNKRETNLFAFFSVNISLVYSAFLVVSLLSFTQSVNLVESFIQFSKLFSVFTATFIIFNVIVNDRNIFKLIIVLGVFLLLFDSFSVFYYIDKFISGEIAGIGDIKSVYSNKNILASALFVKIPFALWLWFFESKWLKKLGFISLLLGILATLFMSTRAFYLGLVLITFAVIGHTLINYYRSKDKIQLNLLIGYISTLIIAFLIFSFVQSNLYPKIDRTTEGIASQFASLKEGDQSTTNRTNAWTYSLKLLSDHPILGVGSGNWKISVLEHENITKPDYIYLFKAHNDFLETFAETGIIGGILFLLIFILSFFKIFSAFFRKDQQNTPYYQAIFLGSFGLLFYSFDALFNFPADRPEIQLFFAIYLAILTSAIFKENRTKIDPTIPKTGDKSKQLKTNKILYSSGFSILMIFLMSASIYIFIQNFKSSKLQRLVYEDILAGKLRQKADFLIENLPDIPNLSIWGESMSALKARYLLEEKRYTEVIEVLRDDKSNPFDSRREHFMSASFNYLNQPDSTLKYCLEVLRVKPNFFRNIMLLSEKLEQKGKKEEASEYIDGLLKNIKNDQQAWLYAAIFYERNDNIEKAYQKIDSALLYLPNDSLIKQQHQYLKHKLFIEPYFNLYTEASDLYNKGKYAEAIPLLDQFISHTQFDINAVRLRAYSYYQTGQYEKCIIDITSLIDKQHIDATLINLRGVCYHTLGKFNEACADFKTSMDVGEQSGKTNYQAFCLGKES